MLSSNEATKISDDWLPAFFNKINFFIQPEDCFEFGCKLVVCRVQLRGGVSVLSISWSLFAEESSSTVLCRSSKQCEKECWNTFNKGYVLLLFIKVKKHGGPKVKNGCSSLLSLRTLALSSQNHLKLYHSKAHLLQYLIGPLDQIVSHQHTRS